MAEPHYTERQPVAEQRSNGSLAFIVGGLVVAVAFIIWLFANGSSWSTYTAPAATQPAGETNISIDNMAPAAEPAAPAAEPAAPVDTAPAVPVETAPAAPAQSN
ncbi:MAG: hypothetical protein ABI459_07605 [Deltaproteobacteria bacterium]